MMLAGKIHFTQAWEADRLDGLPMTAVAAARWPGGGRARRPALAAIGGAVLLHIAAAVLALTFVQVRPPPSPPEDQTVTLVFEQPEAPPAPAPAPEPTPLPAEVAPEPPAPPEAVAPPEPAPPELTPPEPTPPVAVQPPLPEQPPPPSPEEKAVEVPVPVAPPPVVHKPVARAKPAAPPRVAAPQAPGAAEAPKAPAQPAAEQPIAPDWERSLAAWLAAHKVYPELARRRGVEGSVGLRFTADRSGRVLNVSLSRSAGSPLLDAAAEALVRDATLPPFPSAMPQAVATVNVTVRYGLTH